MDLLQVAEVVCFEELFERFEAHVVGASPAVPAGIHATPQSVVSHDFNRVVALNEEVSESGEFVPAPSSVGEVEARRAPTFDHISNRALEVMNAIDSDDLPIHNFELLVRGDDL